LAFKNLSLTVNLHAQMRAVICQVLSISFKVGDMTCITFWTVYTHTKPIKKSHSGEKYNIESYCEDQMRSFTY